MSAVIEPVEILEDEWRGMYRDSWAGAIAPEAFAHPAKYSRALIRFIYEHVLDCGWIKPGDSVVDPFGGVALGGFDAMRHGLHWTGCELEEKFHSLGNQNIALWNDRYSRMPQWGTARLLNGDSRKLATLLDKFRLAVTSPPYVSGGHHNDVMGAWNTNGGGHGVTKDEAGYGAAEGQLGAMKEGDLQATLSISSPPYHGDEKHDSTWQERSERAGKTQGQGSFHSSAADYGTTEGNLGAMQNGDHAIAITSPPYNPPMSQDHNGSRGGQRGTTPSENGAFVKYGNAPGQLEGLSMDGFDAAISSPPFPQPYTSGGGINVKGYGDGSDKVGDRTYQSKGGDRSEGNLETMDDKGFRAAISSPPYEGIRQDGAGIAKEGQGGFGAYTDEPVDHWHTQRDQNNIGNLKTGEDFWSASRIILEQLYQVIVPGGHAVFVVKAFVRNKQIVDFPAQWAQLCEAVGFRLVHHHRALLTEEHGTQTTFHGEDKTLTIARKSFFRRLAESKGSPRIDWESVLCFEKATA